MDSISLLFGFYSNSLMLLLLFFSCVRFYTKKNHRRKQQKFVETKNKIQYFKFKRVLLFIFFFEGYLLVLKKKIKRNLISEDTISKSQRGFGNNKLLATSLIQKFALSQKGNKTTVSGASGFEKKKF